jgi:hypothetical protein
LDPISPTLIDYEIALEELSSGLSGMKLDLAHRLACFGWSRYSIQSWFGPHHGSSSARPAIAWLSDTDIPVHGSFLFLLCLQMNSAHCQASVSGKNESANSAHKPALSQVLN